MRTLVIGGTGFMGPHVVRMLHERGHRVTVFHRGQSVSDLPDGVEELLGARARLREFRARFRRLRPDVVLDMIALTQSDAEEVTGVFDAVAGRLVVISSQDVYRAYDVLRGLDPGPIEPSPLTEESTLRTRLFPYRGLEPRPATDPQRWMDDYDKILVERVALDPQGLPCTVLRLPMVYGPADPQHRMWEYLRRMIDGRPAILLDEGLAQWRWTRGFVENVAAAIVLAATDDRARGRVFNVGEPDALSGVQWVEAIAAAYGWAGRIVAVPESRLPDSLRIGADTRQHLVTDTSRIRTELGYREHVSRDEAIRRTVEWEISHPPREAESRLHVFAVEDQVLATLPSA